MNLLVAIFCLGVYTLLAQMLVTRELAVLCLGNELTIGVVFSVWLLLIGAGAGLGRGLSGTLSSPAQESRAFPLLFLFLWLAAALPGVIAALRLGAGWIRPAGEYVSFARVLAAALLALVPVCLPAGMAFPGLCEALVRLRGRGVVGRVYAIESFGSFLAGVAFAFILVDHLDVSRIAVIAMALAGAGAAAVSHRRRVRWLLLAGALGLALLGVKGGAVSELEQLLDERRWAGLGVVHDGLDGRPAVTLRAGVDTRYQNLALVESAGLFTLYGDGQVMASFPDEVACERAIHVVMAQNPRARRILLLGGNPAGELPVLLRYPVSEVVHVERDDAVGRLVRLATPGLAAALDRDPRLKRVLDDGPRYVKRCGSKFDVVLVHAGEPVTGAINRYFTREFYGDVRSILSPSGFMHTTLEASERMERDASRLAGSVSRTLESVFPVVKVTAGSPLSFFAGGPQAGLTLDGEKLYQRSLASSVPFKSFNPLYFLDADELAPDKIAFTQQRLLDAGAPLNTVMRPVSCYYTLIMWSRYSNSTVGTLLRGLERLNPAWLVTGLILLGAAVLAVAGLMGRTRPEAVDRAGAWQAMAVTGFCGVGLELVVLYASQGFFGYVYGRMGFMVGLFMLGAVAGAWQLGRIETEAGTEVRRAVALCLLTMTLLAVVVWWSLVAGVPSELLLFGLVAAVGAVVGMQFVAVSRLLVLTGSAEGAAAGIAWLADYWGSALGGLLAGVFIPVVFGIAVTTLLLAALSAASLIFCLLFTAPARLKPGGWWRVFFS